MSEVHLRRLSPEDGWDKTKRLVDDIKADSASTALAFLVAGDRMAKELRALRARVAELEQVIAGYRDEHDARMHAYHPVNTAGNIGYVTRRKRRKADG